MENNNYKIDKLAIFEQVQTQALEKFEEIEKKCSKNAVVFLKENYSNIKIRDRKSEPNFKILLAVCWNKICGLAGIKKEVDSFVIEDITKMILYAYSDLTIEEIYKAFELERYGLYEIKTEHYQEFNADYISVILKKFISWKSTTKIQHNISSPKAITQPEMSEEEKENILINAVNRVYQEYISTGEINQQSEYLFDFLVEKGKIKNSNNPALLEYYQLKLKEATSQLKTEISSNKAISGSDRDKIKIDLEQIVSGESPKIIIRAKRNILIEFFKKQMNLKQQNIF